MPSKEPKHRRPMKLVERVPEPDVSDDDVIASLVTDASERDLAALLHEFPRDSAFVLAIYAQFLARGSTWPGLLKGQTLRTRSRGAAFTTRRTSYAIREITAVVKQRRTAACVPDPFRDSQSSWVLAHL